MGTRVNKREGHPPGRNSFRLAEEMTMNSTPATTSTRGFTRFAQVLFPLALLGAGVALISVDASAPARAAPKKDDNYRLSSLRVFNRVVLLVKEQYVEPERIAPKKMLVDALEAVEKQVPEVLVEETQENTLSVVVGNERRTFFLNDITSLWELSFKLRDVFRFIETRISSDVDRREVEYAAVNGMLSYLDPHSVLLEPRYSKEMRLSTKGEFGGLGIVISQRDGFLTVISPIDGTPASKAGILAQDRIVKIGEESTINMGLDDAVERLRGKPGTKITIWITRKGMKEPKKVVITRAIIKVDSVTHQLLDKKLGYVKVKQFQGHTAEDVHAAVQKMRQEAGGQLSGLILDLRNNPGGLLDQSVEVSNLFLDDGVIVVTQEGGAKGERKEIRAVPRPGKIEVPLVVLVNGGSASASEIVSGAMKNRDRGLIVGTQTFGKGSVQQLYDFPDTSSLKLTIGQYLTPGDESIQSVGITPDVNVEPVFAGSKESLNLFADRYTKEADLAAHLDDDRIRKRKPIFDLDYLAPELDTAELERRAASSKFHDDFEIAFARRVLESASGNTRSALLNTARAVTAQVEVEESKKIVAALRKLNIDWTLGAAAKDAQIAARVVSAEPVKAGDTAKVTLEVKNVGAEPLHRVRGVSKATISLLNDQEFLFGKLEPGATATWTAEVKMPKDVQDRLDIMRVQFSEGMNRKLSRLDVPVTTLGLARPAFSYALFVDDTESGNGDGLLQVGETVDLVASIKNSGEGEAEKPTALLKNLGGAETFIAKGRQNLDALKSGKSGVARFRFRVQKDRDGKAPGEVELRLQVFDSVMGDYLAERIELPVYPDAKSASVDKGVVKANREVAVRAAADRSAPVVALATEGAKLAKEARVGDYLRVNLGQKMHGYVAAADVGPAKGRVALSEGRPMGLSYVYGRDPPRVSFPKEKTDSVVVDGDLYALTVRIEDDGPVNDVYIFNGNEKVFYKRLRTSDVTDESFDAKIELKPGVNVLTVVAREDDEFAQRRVLTVFSKKGDPLEDRKKTRH